MLKTYRPAGNAISLKKSRFDKQRFGPFDIKLYQSGTASLAAAIIASINLNQKNLQHYEVILPAYACPDLVSAILYTGATPVLIDLEHDSPHISIPALKTGITANTVAIIVVNFLGLSENLDQVKQICSENGISFILDSAQWFPRKEDFTAWAGDFNIISFGRGKPVSLLSGGAVLTTRQDYFDALPAAKNEPASPMTAIKLTLKILVYNIAIQPWCYGVVTRLPGLHIGETKFKPLNEIRRVDSFYQELIGVNIRDYSQRQSLVEEIHSKLNNISNRYFLDLLPDNAAKDTPVLLRYPILIKSRALRDEFYSLTRDLGVSILYCRPLNEIPGLEEHLDVKTSYPQASEFSDYLVTLPVHAQADAKLIGKIITRLESVLSHAC